MNRSGSPRETARSNLETVEVFILAEEITDRTADVVAVCGEHAGLQIHASIRWKGGYDPSESPQRREHRWTGRKLLTQKLPIVVEEWVCVDIIRREYLADGPLKSVRRQTLPEIRLADTYVVEYAPRSRRRNCRSRANSTLQRRQVCSQRTTIFHCQIERQCIRFATVQQLVRKIKRQLAADRVRLTISCIREILPQHAP